MVLRSFKDDFTGYPNGDLDGQGSTGVWHRNTDHPGTIHVNDAGDYIYTAGNNMVNYYNTASTVESKVYMKVVFSLAIDYGHLIAGFCNVPLEPPIDYEVHTGFYMSFYDGYGLYLACLYNHSYPTQIYIGDYTPGTVLTVEFVHNYETELFEYFKCEPVGYHETDVQGSNISHVPALSSMEYAYSPNSKVFSWEWQELGGASPYLSYPRWQPTKLGMRPFY
jgi:hypothetical protein